MKKCQRCGKEYDDYAKWCISCSIDLETQKEKPEVDILKQVFDEGVLSQLVSEKQTCPNCKGDITNDAKEKKEIKCPHCSMILIKKEKSSGYFNLVSWKTKTLPRKKFITILAIIVLSIIILISIAINR